MRIYDITVTVSSETPVYAGDPGVEINTFKAIATGSTANVSQISLGVHTATHIDAPNHFIDGGATGISLLISALTKIPLYILIIGVNIPFVILAYNVLGKQSAELERLLGEDPALRALPGKFGFLVDAGGRFSDRFCLLDAPYR